MAISHRLLVLFHILLMANFLSASPNEISNAIHRFLYNHVKICGDMFAEGHIWLPAHERCEIECDMLSEVCQESVRDSKIKAQRCLQLPTRCVDKLRKRLYGLYVVDDDDKSIENEISQFQGISNKIRGITVSGTTEEKPLKPMGLDVQLIKASGVSSFHVPQKAAENEESTEEPFSTIELLKDFGVTAKSTPNPKDESLFNEILHTSTTSFIQSKLGEEENNVDESVINKFFEETFTDIDSVPSSTNGQSDSTLVTIPPPPSYTTESPLNVETDDKPSFIASDNTFDTKPFSQPVGTISQNWLSTYHKEMDNRLKMPEVTIFGPPFSSRSSTNPMMEMPAPSSTSNPLSEKNDFNGNHYFPLSWRELANRLKKKPFYSLEDGQEVDQSPRCCEYALDGLCDRSHQRIRAICRKSCGSVVCSSVDGALSCSRAINVDVIDCYERRRYHSYTSTHQRQLSAPIKKISTPSDDVSVEETPSYQKPSKQKKLASSMLQRAYAIEDEIRSFLNMRNFHNKPHGK